MIIVMFSSMKVTASPAPSYLLTINTEEYPPFNHGLGGDIQGYATERLQQALEQTGIEARFYLLPWARAYTEARLRRDHCVYSTTRTPQREALFRWAGPLAANEWAAFALEGHAGELIRLEDLAGLRVGSFREDAVGDYVKSQGIDVIRAPSERVNIARLEAGFLDVIVSGRTPGEFIAQDEGIPLVYLFSFAHVPLYLACNPSVPRQVMDKIQHAIRALP